MITLSSKYNDPPPLVWDKFCAAYLSKTECDRCSYLSDLNKALEKYSGKISIDEMDYYTLEFEHEKDYLYFLMEWS